MAACACIGHDARGYGEERLPPIVSDCPPVQLMAAEEGDVSQLQMTEVGNSACVPCCAAILEQEGRRARARPSVNDAMMRGWATHARAHHKLAKLIAGDEDFQIF